MSDPTRPPTANPRVIVALLVVILAAQGFYAGVDVFLASPVPDSPLGIVVSLAWVVYATMIGLCAYAAWRRLPWAWSLAMAIPVVGIVLAGLQILAGDRPDDHLLGVIIDGALLYYLTRPHIRAAFAA